VQRQQQQVSQHSDSTTYVSPSPALSAAALQRIQSGYFHSRFATGESSTGRREEKPKLPERAEQDLPEGAVEGRQAEGPVRDRAGTPGDFIAPLPADGGDEEEREPSVAASLQEELVAAEDADAAVVTAGDAVAAASHRAGGTVEHAQPVPLDASTLPVNQAILQTHARLRACLAELRGTTDDRALLAAEGATGLPSELTAEQALSAAIRASHELTGILLEQWNKAHSPR
jgi:hypothetical protein